jgi:hypothetical protein
MCIVFVLFGCVYLFFMWKYYPLHTAYLASITTSQT